MTIAPLRSLVAALAIILLTVAACAETPPSDAESTPADAAPAMTPPRPSAVPDPSVVADAATYAQWRRSPVRPTPEFASAVEQACRADHVVGDAPLVVLDVRGEGRAILVFADATSAAVCVVQDDGSGGVTAQAHAVPGFPEADPPAEGGRLGVHELFTVDAGASSYSVLVGTYNPTGVRDVSANFDADAAWYTATADNDWYAIWWPGQSIPMGVATSNNRSEVIHSYAP